MLLCLFQMFRLAVISCMLVVAFAAQFTAELDNEWESYKMTHNKQYQTDIEPLRFVVSMQTHYKLGNLILFHANNKDAEQPAYWHSLISAFVYRYQESIVVKHLHALLNLVVGVDSLASWIELDLVQPPVTGLFVTRPIYSATDSKFALTEC